jgi:hypothetical protein
MKRCRMKLGLDRLVYRFSAADWQLPNWQLNLQRYVNDVA